MEKLDNLRWNMADYSSLHLNRPELEKEWDFTKNYPLTPKDVSTWSHRKVFWKCSKNHTWSASIASRSRGLGCPYCSGQRVWVGYNDLKTVKPDLAAEWNYDKNDGLKPTDVSISSGRKVWWICPRGHEYQAVIANRSKGTGCRICQRENQTSFPEQALFYYIYKVFPDAENRNTSALEGKELDIYIPSIRTGIEFDGKKWHAETTRDEEV